MSLKEDAAEVRDEMADDNLANIRDARPFFFFIFSFHFLAFWRF